jgi:type II restriction/modification system DNA methylase subunit YeeA
MRQAFGGISRYIATPRVSEHRFFVWIPVTVLPDSRLVAIARDDDATFGVLESRIHRIWALAKVALHGVGDDPTYNTKEIFETFPFPEIVTLKGDNRPSDCRLIAITKAAKKLNDLRDSWLNPEGLVRSTPEVVSCYPDRVEAVDSSAHKALRKLTMTNFYNDPPPWYHRVQNELDEAVAAAYGWPTDLSDEEVLSRLLALNQERCSRETGREVEPTEEDIQEIISN